MLCDCHLYCDDGDKPSDCTIISIKDYAVTHTLPHEVGWPFGLHNDPDDESDDIMHVTGYCTIHDKYIYKNPILIPCDWDYWFSHRAPKELRDSHGEY